MHCGASAVTLEELEATPTPEPTSTWQPIPHTEMLSQIKSILPIYGMRIVEEAHGLTHDGLRHFGLIQIQNGCNSPDYSWVLGCRNSHDKAFAAGIVAGAQVFVCDNLAFSGEIKIGRKHTTRILFDLNDLIHSALQSLVFKWQDQDRRINAYKNTRLKDSQAHDLTIRALDMNACCGSQIPGIIEEWRQPSHADFQERNAWSLFNAFTERLKGSGLHTLASRTERLHSVMDAYVGLN